MIKVMVVDDERDVEHMFRQKFRREIRSGDIDLKFAFSGEEAVEILNGLNPLDVVLLLSDINMPGMNGFDLLKVVKNDYPQLRVFMVSAYGDADNYDTAKNLGADAFVNKPVDFGELKEKIFNLKESN